METFTTTEVARATGASYRQLDHWVRAGYLPTAGHGTGYSRVWSARTVGLAARIAALTVAGVEPKRAAELARVIVEEPDCAQGVTVGAVTITLDIERVEREWRAVLA